MQLTSKCLFSGDESSRKVSIYMYMYNKLAIYRIMRLIIIINYLMKKKSFGYFHYCLYPFSRPKQKMLGVRVKKKKKVHLQRKKEYFQTGWWKCQKHLPPKWPVKLLPNHQVDSISSKIQLMSCTFNKPTKYMYNNVIFIWFKHIPSPLFNNYMDNVCSFLQN